MGNVLSDYSRPASVSQQIKSAPAFDTWGLQPNNHISSLFPLLMKDASQTRRSAPPSQRQASDEEAP